ncbi:putative tocopherol C-methyltransferase [Helianthus annuus]|nr:putative tocopherol C-methyltransferase [Helianthus annuus]
MHFESRVDFQLGVCILILCGLNLITGWKTIRGALVMPLMIEGFQKGVIKFSIITCRKPE